MKTVAVFVFCGVLMALSAAVVGGCAWLNKPAPPACQGDPSLKPCTCMDARTPGCPSPPNDDAKKAHKESAK
jgi:hypothetical protein